MIREVWWKSGSRFPEPVWRSIGMGAGLGVTFAAWAALVGKGDFAYALILEAIAIPVLYMLVVARNYPFLMGSWKAGRSDWVVVGDSLEHGRPLVLYGAGAWLGLFFFAQIPTWFLGIPQYAFAVASAFAVAVVAPVVEERFVGGALWSYLYNVRAVPRAAAFGFATLGSAALFAAIHQGTYGAASDFAYLQVFAMRVIFSVANWLPTFAGHQPSLVPSTLGHMATNGVWVYVTCYQGTGLQSAFATSLC